MMQKPKCYKLLFFPLSDGNILQTCGPPVKKIMTKFLLNRH